MDKIEFKDIKAEHFNRYDVKNVTTGDVFKADLKADFGAISQEGTPVVAAVMNQLQDNIEDRFLKTSPAPEHDLFAPKLTAPSGSVTYNHNQGESFKIGKLVTAFFSIYVKSSTLSGNVYINGFPFKRSSSTTFDVEEPISAYGLTNVADSGFSAFLRTSAGTDSFRVGYAYKSGSNNIGVAILTGDQVKDGTVIRGRISYITD